MNLLSSYLQRLTKAEARSKSSSQPSLTIQLHDLTPDTLLHIASYLTFTDQLWCTCKALHALRVQWVLQETQVETFHYIVNESGAVKGQPLQVQCKVTHTLHKKLHREGNLPAVIEYNSDGQVVSEDYCVNGQVHREDDLPASWESYVGESGASMQRYIYMLRGKQHRRTGYPAVCYRNIDTGIVTDADWFRSDRLHNTHGPAQRVLLDADHVRLVWMIDGKFQRMLTTKLADEAVAIQIMDEKVFGVDKTSVDWNAATVYTPTAASIPPISADIVARLTADFHAKQESEKQCRNAQTVQRQARLAMLDAASRLAIRDNAANNS